MMMFGVTKPTNQNMLKHEETRAVMKRKEASACVCETNDNPLSPNYISKMNAVNVLVADGGCFRLTAIAG